MSSWPWGSSCPFGDFLNLVTTFYVPDILNSVLFLESFIFSLPLCLYLFLPPGVQSLHMLLPQVGTFLPLFLWLTASLPSEHLGFFIAEVFTLVFGIRHCCLLGDSHALWTNQAATQGVFGEVKLWWNIQGIWHPCPNYFFLQILLLLPSFPSLLPELQKPVERSRESLESLTFVFSIPVSLCCISVSFLSSSTLLSLSLAMDSLLLNPLLRLHFKTM